MERPYDLVHKNATENFARYLAKDGEVRMPTLEPSGEPTYNSVSVEIISA